MGILMPLADASKIDIVALWVTQLKGALDEVNSFQIGVGRDRIKEFQLSKSISQTIKVVKEI
jgi:hypothetical protein